jgi:hypothetical protein
MQNTLSVSSFNLILFAAQQKGAEVALLCQKVGLEPNLLQNPDEYIFRRIKLRNGEIITASAVRL